MGQKIKGNTNFEKNYNLGYMLVAEQMTLDFYDDSYNEDVKKTLVSSGDHNGITPNTSYKGNSIRH